MPTVKSQQAKRRRELCKANGLCTRCGQVPVSKGWCTPCRAIMRAHGDNYRRRQKAAGKCQHCGNPAVKSCCDKCKARKRLSAQLLKLEAFNAYGGAVCACCGEAALVFLTLDHKDGG